MNTKKVLAWTLSLITCLVIETGLGAAEQWAQPSKRKTINWKRIEAQIRLLSSRLAAHIIENKPTEVAQEINKFQKDFLMLYDIETSKKMVTYLISQVDKLRSWNAEISFESGTGQLFTRLTSQLLENPQSPLTPTQVAQPPATVISPQPAKISVGEVQLNYTQQNAAHAIAAGITKNEPQLVEGGFNAAFTILKSQKPEEAKKLAKSLLKEINTQLESFGGGALSSYDNRAITKLSELMPESTKSLLKPLPKLTRDELPTLTKDQLIYQINETKNIIQTSMSMFNALTIPHDNKILVVGDIHASSAELISAINLMREEGYFRLDNPWQLQDNYYLIFTGDIADRGPDDLGTWQIVMSLIQNNPKKCIVMRGNHETSNIATMFELADNLPNKYQKNDDAAQIFDAFIELFNELPNVLFLGIIQPNDTVLFGMYCHGGPDPRISSDSIKNLIAESMQHQNELITKSFFDMERELAPVPRDFVPDGDNGFLWSDFDPNIKTIKWNDRRGAGYIIGPLNVQQFLEAYSSPKAEVLYIVRAHEHMRGCINKLNAATAAWELLNGTQIIEPYSVFTFMCLKSGIVADDKRNLIVNTQAGFGLIEMNEKNQLTITPHIAPQIW